MKMASGSATPRVLTFKEPEPESKDDKEVAAATADTTGLDKPIEFDGGNPTARLLKTKRKYDRETNEMNFHAAAVLASMDPQVGSEEDNARWDLVGPGQLHILQDTRGRIVEVRLISKKLNLGKSIRANTPAAKDILAAAMNRPQNAFQNAGPWSFIQLNPRKGGEPQTHLRDWGDHESLGKKLARTDSCAVPAKKA